MRAASVTLDEPNCDAFLGLVSRAHLVCARPSTSVAPMVSLAEYPALLVTIFVLGIPVYRAMALSIFGGRDGVSTAIAYFKLPQTWSPFRSPWSGDLAIEFRLFFFLISSIALIAATYQLAVKFFIPA